MKRALLRPSIAVVTSISLIACSSPPHDPAVAAARQNVLKTRKTYIQGVAAGAALGAAAGAGIGAIAGSTSGRAGPGALVGLGVGAVVGGIGGFFYAQHVVSQRRMYASAGEYLTACTSVASAQRASVQNYNNTLAERRDAIATDKRQLTASIEDSEKVRTRLRQEIKLQQDALTQARSENVPQSKINDQLRQIALLKTEDRRLTAEIDRLTALDSEAVLSSN